ncbi:GT-D fold domain-containing glycosyltransferase [Erysipelatoclostridium sp. An15]|uniref:GT-D fold domain-containing glycosyltransferase n=1 Tax=Erysipelatoclostridium sp. An15 TaxID=1965566 RepID=UPI001302E629|nr:GT-D fold domain-containing glycosyltransferase [Erysipelatoclostridium sp. An15]
MSNFNIKKILILFYEFCYEKKRIYILRLRYRLRIMSPDRTIKYIKKNNCSIARFGDGEFDLIFKKRDLHFQNQSNNISTGLKNVLQNKNKNLLICIPRCMNTTLGCNNHSKTFWIEWGKNNHHQEIVDMLRNYVGKNYLFGDSQISRPYIDWKNSKRAKRTFPKLKKLWSNKNIIIVEGEQTRLGVGNDLFDNATSIKRILTPAINAFDYYDNIFEEIIKNRLNEELIIMAIGPTATVLASDLSKLNIQAIDIGNIDIEYEWYIRRAKKREAIPGKFTNEANDGRVYTSCNNKKYLCEIICKIGC